jgi:hypothetical protein
MSKGHLFIATVFILFSVTTALLLFRKHYVAAVVNVILWMLIFALCLPTAENARYLPIRQHTSASP